MVKEVGVLRIKPDIIRRIKYVLGKNDNRLYCDSISTFATVSVIQLLEDIEKKGNKIRWGKNE